jgi:hypothetical protein
VPLDCLEKVLPEVQLVDKCFLLPKYRHEDVFDTDLEKGGIDVAEILLVPFEGQVFLLLLIVQAWYIRSRALVFG